MRNAALGVSRRPTCSEPPVEFSGYRAAHLQVRKNSRKGISAEGVSLRNVLPAPLGGSDPRAAVVHRGAAGGIAVSVGQACPDRPGGLSYRTKRGTIYA